MASPLFLVYTLPWYYRVIYGMSFDGQYNIPFKNTIPISSLFLPLLPWPIINQILKAMMRI